MRNDALTTMVRALLLLIASSAISPVFSAEALPDESQCAKSESTDPVIQGWCIAINRVKGNCLACHGVTTKSPWPETLPPGGNIAPPLVAMKQRFPDTAKLRAQVYDATAINPGSVMPPFGKHKLLTDKELDLVVEWLNSI